MIEPQGLVAGRVLYVVQGDAYLSQYGLRCAATQDGGTRGGLVAATVTLARPNDDGWPNGAAIAARAGQFLVVWEEVYMPSPYGSPPPQSARIRGTRLSAELVPLDPTGISITDREHDSRYPAVTWNGREWLVLFNTVAPPAPPDWEYSPELRGRHVSREGVAAGPAAGVFIASGGEFPSVAWDGSRYFLTWHNGTVNTVQTAVLSALGQPLSHEKTVERLFDWIPVPLVTIRPGIVAATYARTAVEPPYGNVVRAFANFLMVRPRQRAVR